MSIQSFITSGETTCFRSPYMRLDDSPINMSLAMPELTKVHFLLACIRHSWSTHVNRESAGFDEMLATLTRVCDGGPTDLSTFRQVIDRYQVAFDAVKATVTESDRSGIPAANVMFCLGELASWLYHAFVAATEDDALEWFPYVMSGDHWLPFWLVLDGCASTGEEERGENERAWQEQAVRGFA